MVLPSGESAISFSQIRAEFGTDGDNTNGPVRLGQYRSDDASFTNKNIGELTNLPLDEGIPTSVSAGSSSINLDSFHGKKLNTVVDLYTSGNSTYNYNAKTERFDNGDYTIVGGYKSTLVESIESWNGGKKMIIHINNTFSSTGAVNQDDVALTVGNTWLVDTTFLVDVGSSGMVVGKGGNGGDGGDGGGDESGDNGGHGTSALAVETGTPVNIVAGGQINPGGGGGGGGVGAEVGTGWGRERAGGGGGGGGAGLPAGEGGTGGTGAGGADDGGDGTLTTGGAGGIHSDSQEAQGRDGGPGGSIGKITSVTLNNGGSGYYEDEDITISGGYYNATFKVGTVDYATGTVTSIIWQYVGGGGYDPAIGTNVATTGGSGSNLTVDYSTADGLDGGWNGGGAGVDSDDGAGGEAGHQIIYF